MSIKKKWISARKEFYKLALNKCKDNPTFCMLIIKTYSAHQHRRHIMEIWYISRNHKDFKREYDAKLLGKHLTGIDDINQVLYFTDTEMRDFKLPETYKMGCCVSAAYKSMKEMGY